MSFGREMQKIAKAMSEDVETVQRGVTLSVFNSVIMNTRVKTGRARGNWQTTEGAPAGASIDRLDPNGTEANAEAEREFKPASLMILSNNLVYIGKLEELDGMVGKTEARIRRIIQEQARKS